MSGRKAGAAYGFNPAAGKVKTGGETQILA